MDPGLGAPSEEVAQVSRDEIGLFLGEIVAAVGDFDGEHVVDEVPAAPGQELFG